MSADIIPFPAREPAVPIGEMSRDEVAELLDQVGQISATYTYTAPRGEAVYPLVAVALDRRAPAAPEALRPSRQSMAGAQGRPSVIPRSLTQEVPTMTTRSPRAAKAQSASTSTKDAPARGFLRAPFQAVRIDVRDYQRHVIVRYLGMAQDLLSASCATKAMLGKSRGQHLQDEDGHEVWKRRAPSKRQPDRIMIGRSVSREVALTLPGVRDLFPRGFPDPDAPQSAAEWKRRVRRYCNMPLGVVDMLRGEAGMSYFSGGFRLQPIDVERIAAKQQRFIAELLAEIDRAPVIDTQRSGPGLRLVIDNTREAS